MNSELIKQLLSPFPFEKIEAKIQAANDDKAKGVVVFRLTANAIQERLDTVIGPFDWRNEYIAQQDNSKVCGLSLYNSERKEWIVKYSCADNYNDAFTQSAALWGIGRYMQRIEGVWVDVEQCDGGYCIKGGQQSILKNAYDKAVAEIFGTAAPQSTTADMTGEQEPQNTKSPQQPSAPVEPEYDYKVRTVKQSGKNSQLLELVNKNGDVTAAYIKANDQGIKTGMGLNRVTFERKNSTYGEYNLIASYQIAA